MQGWPTSPGTVPARRPPPRWPHDDECPRETFPIDFATMCASLGHRQGDLHPQQNGPPLVASACGRRSVLADPRGTRIDTPDPGRIPAAYVLFPG